MDVSDAMSQDVFEMTQYCHGCDRLWIPGMELDCHLDNCPWRPPRWRRSKAARYWLDPMKEPENRIIAIFTLWLVVIYGLAAVGLGAVIRWLVS